MKVFSNVLDKNKIYSTMREINKDYGSALYIRDINTGGTKRKWFQFHIQNESKHVFSGRNIDDKNKAICCFHGVGEVIKRLYELDNEMRVETGLVFYDRSKVVYENKEDFRIKKNHVAEINIGSMKRPFTLKEACFCHTHIDELEAMKGSLRQTKLIQTMKENGLVHAGDAINKKGE